MRTFFDIIDTNKIAQSLKLVNQNQIPPIQTVYYQEFKIDGSTIINKFV